ncbi:lipid II:glycine glycyltransferase FemX [Sinomonas mesophila]|uniref:lipid II:glycine glycyltransferase FemX n=1 Tax=Sinomonas mesophila TaxID=1531955 RepID=UPI000984B4FE|nr:peptidoglycan bridge formation glycyltransferase FemA/FemB family protein [Sinomonas mesophila]
MEHFLQTPLWGEVQRALGRTVVERAGSGWRYLAILERNALGTILYAPYGPVAKTPEALRAALASLAGEAHRLGAMAVRVEPVAAPLDEDVASLRALGLTRAPSDQQPERTWVIDLRGDEKDILGAMKPTNRNLHRNIHKKGVSIRSSQDPAELEILLGFLHATAARGDFTPQSDSYLRTVAEILMPAGGASLWVAELEGAPIAAALVYDTADTRTYAHAAIDDTHRRLSAGIPLVVALILDAKAKGLTWVDLWGIAPTERPDHRWAGFSAFKKSFGGHEVVRTGTWDLPVNRSRYAAYQGMRSLRGVVRSVARTVLSRGKALLRRG